MAAVNQATGSSRPGSPTVWAKRAWTAVVLIPPFFLLALAVGYVGYDWLGYQPENADAPLWVDLLSGALSLAVLLVPCVAAVRYGRRASAAGERRGAIPAAIGAIAGIGFTVLTVLSTVGPVG